MKKQNRRGKQATIAAAARTANKKSTEARAASTTSKKEKAPVIDQAVAVEATADAMGATESVNATNANAVIPAEEAPKKLTCTAETSLRPEQMLELYRFLKLTRLVEERLVNLYRQTKVVGGVFRSLGQEATAVGTCYALEPQDFIAPLIRDLGAVLTKGVRERDIFAQYMAKAWGPSEGRDLNIHFGDLASRRHDSGNDWNRFGGAHAEETDRRARIYRRWRNEHRRFS
jgi:pyruvate dehydrogenase E1 component alpha subunit/2-oxoisovalerate dehydrogenase E1 component alpha subunit